MSTIAVVSDPYQDLLFEALEHAHECILVTDSNGIILYMNKTYEEFLNVHNTIGRARVRQGYRLVWDGFDKDTATS